MIFIPEEGKTNGYYDFGITIMTLKSPCERGEKTLFQHEDKRLVKATSRTLRIPDSGKFPESQKL